MASPRSSPFAFAMGVVNLFADVTEAGGGSINGPLMSKLGAGAGLVCDRSRAASIAFAPVAQVAALPAKSRPR
jgi:hypothetical protein